MSKYETYKSYHGSDVFNAVQFYWPIGHKGCWAKLLRGYLASRKAA